MTIENTIKKILQDSKPIKTTFGLSVKVSPYLKHYKPKCEHLFVYYIGTQEGFEDVPSFEIGNCCRCKTTLNIDAYHIMNGCYFNGNQLYQKSTLLGDE